MERDERLCKRIEGQNNLVSSIEGPYTGPILEQKSKFHGTLERVVEEVLGVFGCERCL